MRRAFLCVMAAVLLMCTACVSSDTVTGNSASVLPTVTECPTASITPSRTPASAEEEKYMNLRKELDEKITGYLDVIPETTYYPTYDPAGKKNIYALDGTEILLQKDYEVQMAVRSFGKGRGVYISGLPYSFKNSRVLYRAVLWSASAEEELHCWYSTNYNVEVHAYVKNGKYCVVNNTYEPQDTTVYRGDGSSFDLHLEANEIKWYEI